MSTSPQYEFTDEQNVEIRDLAGKMRFVGLFSIVFGVFALLLTLVIVLFIFRDRLPAGFREGAAKYYEQAKAALPPDLKKTASEYGVDKIPTDNTFLTGVAIFAGAVGVIFLLQGIWSRASASSFQQVVDTKGNDIDNLMNALGSLRGMYTMVSTMLTVALLVGLVALVLSLYQYFTVR